MADVNWAAYSTDQLRELELLHLAEWPVDVAASGIAEAAKPASVPIPASKTAPPPNRMQGTVPDSREASSTAGVPMPSAVQRPVTPTQSESRVNAAAATISPAAVRRTPAAGLGEADWSALKGMVSKCEACVLCKQRKQAVFGTGAESGPWLFVGEGPGSEEDESGEPFVGQAGKLLDAMLASIQLSRKTNTYIANVVKCRPPGNRPPTQEEAASCADWLDRQIDLVSPRLIVALGKTAAVRLTGEEGSLAGLRGRQFTYRGYPLLVTYHPAYLLRNLPDKAKAWEDLLRARRIFAEQG